MRLKCPYLSLLCHDVSESFGDLLRQALKDHRERIGVALGPIYRDDPAEKLLFPFMRADVETGWSTKPKFPDGLPPHVGEEVLRVRQEYVDTWFENTPWWGDPKNDEDMIDDWTRAGLILEICSRRGVNIRGFGKAHVKWRLNGTETGRFGASYTVNKSAAFPNGFNPLTIPKAERNLVVPSKGGRLVGVIDFKAMDLSSMLALVPGLGRKYEGSWDHHMRTAEILGVERDVAKEQIFTHAYGGQSTIKEQFEKFLPELNNVRSAPHGQFPRQVQTLSAKAFRAGLARALPLLLGDDVIPMFTVHDELVLDVDEGSLDNAVEVADALQEGASDRIGVGYMTSLKWGLNYAEAKQ